MRRGGRAHGMVKTQPIVQDPDRKPRGNYFNIINCPPTAGVFTKMPSRPTNHSKPSGLKANKTKGCNKNCSKRFGSKCDIVFNPHYVLWKLKNADFDDDDHDYEDRSDD